MNAALERLRDQHTVDVKLEDEDLLVTLKPPPMRKCIAMAGGIPMPLVEKLMATEKGTLPDLSDEQYDKFAKFQSAVVTLTLRAVEGEPFDGLPSDADLDELSEEQYQEIFLYGSRAKPLPGKA